MHITQVYRAQLRLLPNTHIDITVHPRVPFNSSNRQHMLRQSLLNYFPDGVWSDPDAAVADPEGTKEKLAPFKRKREVPELVNTTSFR